MDDERRDSEWECGLTVKRSTKEDVPFLYTVSVPADGADYSAELHKAVDQCLEITGRMEAEFNRRGVAKGAR